MAVRTASWAFPMRPFAEYHVRALSSSSAAAWTKSARSRIVTGPESRHLYWSPNWPAAPPLSPRVDSGIGFGATLQSLALKPRPPVGRRALVRIPRGRSDQLRHVVLPRWGSAGRASPRRTARATRTRPFFFQPVCAEIVTERAPGRETRRARPASGRRPSSLPGRAERWRKPGARSRPSGRGAAGSRRARRAGAAPPRAPPAWAAACRSRS